MEEERKKKNKNKKKKNKKKKNKQNRTTSSAAAVSDDGNAFAVDKAYVSSDNDGKLSDKASAGNGKLEKVDLDSRVHRKEVLRGLDCGNGNAVKVEVDSGVHQRDVAEVTNVTNIDLDSGKAVMEALGVRNGNVEKVELDQSMHQVEGSDNSVSTETEKGRWLQRQVSLENIIQQLHSEIDLHLKKGARSEMRVVELEYEKDSWLLKEANYEKKIAQLLEVKATLILKEANFEERVKHLEKEKEKWLVKEMHLQERTKHLESNENSWIQKENSTSDTINSLNNDNTRLWLLVKELEETRDKLLQENQLLSEKVSTLQMQVQNHEMALSSVSSTEITQCSCENEDLTAARPLVEKLATENMELVDKVKELSIELHRRNLTNGILPVVGPDADAGFENTASLASTMIESSNHSVSSERTEPLDVILHSVDKNNSDSSHSEQTLPVVESSDTIDSAEIVQIPLDENEEQDLESQQIVNSDEKTDVPLTDAPLIGAPFRFLSFVAKYVSGADLVNKGP